MAAPIPSALAFKTAGVDTLQSNLANWVLASDGTTPALRVPVATDTVSYLTAPSDSLSGFNLIDTIHAVTISGTGTVLIGSGDSAELVAGGSSSLFLAGATAGQDLSLVGTSTTARLLVTGTGYIESGDGSGNIQNCDFSGNLDVETVNASYSNSEIGGSFTTDNGSLTFSGMEVMGASFADNQGEQTENNLAGIFHGLAITTIAAYTMENSSSFSGTFDSGQALDLGSDSGFSSPLLYDSQYVESQVTVNHQIFPLPLGF